MQTEAEYYDEILGSPPEPDEINDLHFGQTIGVDKPRIDHIDETVTDDREGEE